MFHDPFYHPHAPVATRDSGLGGRARLNRISNKQIASDQRITEDERKSLEALIKYFGLDLEDIDFNQSTFNKYYAIALIDQGILPTIEEGRHDLNILFKEERCSTMGSPRCYAKSSV